jgi:RNAse (barnase) inhibitor barstar
VLTIDVSPAEDERSLHALLAQALEFPNFYGMNWSAFWDAITGLVQIPTHVRFAGWEHLNDRTPHGAAMLRQALERYQHQYRPDFVAEYF